jgi:transmembrane sensor
MADVHRFPDVREAEREASEWIARLDADDVSAEDRARFDAWRSAHPVHARAYEELAETWRQFKAAGPLVRAVSLAHSMNEAASAHERPGSRWKFALAGAAVVVLASAAGWLYLQKSGPGSTFRTAVGEQTTISLPDGSQLELNSGSLAHVEYTREARIIELRRGEGFFKVAHDTARPFWVVGGGSWVRAVGTAFDVHLRPDGVRVTVSEGAVRIGSADPLFGQAPSDGALASMPASLLSAGEQADLKGAVTTTRKLSSTELSRSVSWRDGTLYFENRPLGDVVDELSRYTRLNLIVDERIRQLPVGGTFEANPQGAEALLTMLRQGFGATVRRDGERVYVESKPRPAEPVAR